jgi:phage replication O-like protein O
LEQGQAINGKAKGFTQVPNWMLEAVLRLPFTDRERRILFAVCRMTYGWRSRKGGLAYSVISKLTGIHSRNVAEAMRNLRESCVLECKGQVGETKGFVWRIQEEMQFWDLRMLKRLRSGERGNRSSKRTETGCIEPSNPGDEQPRVKTALGTQGQSSPTSNKELKKCLKKTSAADGAVSFSQSRERKEGGLLQTQEVSAFDEQSGREIEPRTPTQDQKHHIASLCAELEKADLNPYLWLARRNKKRTPIVLVIEVLEEAVKQKVRIRKFWPWAEGVLRKICEREQIAVLEREQEERKCEFARSAGGILEQIALRAQRKERGEYRGDS